MTTIQKDTKTLSSLLKREENTSRKALDASEKRILAQVHKYVKEENAESEARLIERIRMIVQEEQAKYHEKLKEEAKEKEQFSLIEASCSTVPHTTRRKRNSASQTITLSQRTELTCDTQETKRVREDTNLTSTVSSLIKGAILSHTNQSDLFLIDDFFLDVCLEK